MRIFPRPAGTGPRDRGALGFGSILIRLIANYPLALAPGMGLNAYFTYTVVKAMGVPWETALGCVFLSGLAFLLLTLAGVRQLIVGVIPRSLLAAVAAGIGLFIAFIGLRDAGIIVTSPATAVSLGDLTQPTAALALGGLVLIAALQAWRVRGAILIGVVLTALAAWALGLSHVQPGRLSLSDLSATAFKMDLGGAFRLQGGLALTVLEIVFVFLFVDLFDNIGTLVAVTKRAGLIDETGAIPRLNQIFFADSVATMVGAVAGTSAVTSYIESASGVAAGGRTGLTSVVVGRSARSTGPIPSTPSPLTVVITPLSYSIANGLAFGLTSHAALKLARGKARPKDWLLFVLAGLFIARFVYLSKG